MQHPVHKWTLFLKVYAYTKISRRPKSLRWFVFFVERFNDRNTFYLVSTVPWRYVLYGKNVSPWYISFGGVVPPCYGYLDLTGAVQFGTKLHTTGGNYKFLYKWVIRFEVEHRSWKVFTPWLLGGNIAVNRFILSNGKKNQSKLDNPSRFK